MGYGKLWMSYCYDPYLMTSLAVGAPARGGRGGRGGSPGGRGGFRGSIYFKNENVFLRNGNVFDGLFIT